VAILRKLVFWSGLTLAGAGCIVTSYCVRHSAENQISAQEFAARQEARHLQQTVVLFTKCVMPSGQPFAIFLHTLGIGTPSAARLVASAQSVFDLRRLRAGNQVSVGRSVTGDLREVRYHIDADKVLSIASQGDGFHSEIKTIPSRTESVGVTGQVHGSLFQAVTDVGEKPELALRLAAIFGWDLDFYTDPRPGDTFRVVVEKKTLVNGDTMAYGRIFAAEYNNAGRAYRAILFHDLSGNAAYYTSDGKSMKKAFLHSPLKFAAPITSHFSYSRFHPILKEYRPHLGIDYGAPLGTPVQTIGDGKVIFAGMKGGSGNLIEIQHTNGYTTYYMHLSRILVRNGQRVEQGENIGLVGMTGLATGPHLDFRVQFRGEFLNFERLLLPPTDPVAKRDWNEFVSVRDRAVAQMPALLSEHTTLAVNTSSATVPSR
jgi:murein DD-endopeptidase MepM/ murein hydrolase activator NlpD